MAQAPLAQPASEWAGSMGERWLAHVDQFESMISEVGAALIDKAKFRPGERVIDVGCGGGGTSLEISKRVGPQGSVTGLDISPALVKSCEARARKAGVTNARFVLGDAARAEVKEAPFDRLFSRFGIMFFDDPKAAFAHMRGFLKPGGGAIFACWGPPDENPWIQQTMSLARRFAPQPPNPPPATAPGPFAFGDPGYVREILSTAGFAEIAIDPWRGNQFVGGRGASPEAAAQFMLEALPIGDAVKDQPDKVRRDLRTEVADVLARYHGKDGVKIDAMAWFVSARR